MNLEDSQQMSVEIDFQCTSTDWI